MERETFGERMRAEFVHESLNSHEKIRSHGFPPVKLPLHLDNFTDAHAMKHHATATKFDSEDEKAKLRSAIASAHRVISCTTEQPQNNKMAEPIPPQIILQPNQLPAFTQTLDTRKSHHLHARASIKSIGCIRWKH